MYPATPLLNNPYPAANAVAQVDYSSETSTANPGGSSTTAVSRRLAQFREGVSNWVNMTPPGQEREGRLEAQRRILAYLNPKCTTPLLNLTQLNLTNLPCDIELLAQVATLRQSPTGSTPIEMHGNPFGESTRAKIKALPYALATKFALSPSIPKERNQDPLGKTSTKGLELVSNVLRDHTVPLMRGLCQDLLNCEKIAKSSLQQIVEIHNQVRDRANLNISKTDAHKHVISPLENFSSTDHLRNSEFMLLTTEELSIIQRALNNAHADCIHSNKNASKAQKRIDQLIKQSDYLRQVFYALNDIVTGCPQLLDACEIIGDDLVEINQLESNIASNTLVRLTDAIADVYKRLVVLKDQLKDIPTPDNISELNLVRNLNMWVEVNESKLKNFQLQKNITLLLGRLETSNFSASAKKQLIEQLKTQTLKLPDESPFWDVLLHHPNKALCAVVPAHITAGNSSSLANNRTSHYQAHGEIYDESQDTTSAQPTQNVTAAASPHPAELSAEHLQIIGEINKQFEKNLFKQIGMVVAGTKIKTASSLEQIKGSPFDMTLGMKHVRPREYLRTACQAGEQLKALSAGQNIPAEGPIHLEHLPTPTLPLFRGEEGARNWQFVKDAIRSASASPEARERKRLALQIVGAWATQQALSNNEKLGLYSAVHDQLEASTTLFGLCPADVTQWSLNTRESILDLHAQLAPPKRSAKELVEQGYGSNTYKNDVSAFTLNPTSRQGIFTEAMIKVSGLMGDIPETGLVPTGARTKRAADSLPLILRKTNENSIQEQLGFKPNPNASGQFLFNESAGHNALMDQLVLAATAHNDITIISESEEPGVSRGSLRNRILEQDKHQFKAALKNHRMDGLVEMSNALIHIGQTIRPAVSEHLKTVKNRLNQGEKVTDDQLQQLIKQIIVTTDAQAAQSSNFNMEKLIDAAEELKAADTVERQVKAKGDLAHALNNIEAAWAGSDQNKKTSWQSKDQRSFGDKWVLGANPIKSLPYVNRVPLLGPAAASVVYIGKALTLLPLSTVVGTLQSIGAESAKNARKNYNKL